MPPSPDEQVQRALAVVAHPDDAEFWAGGSIAHWTAADIQVTYCVLTDGNNGGFDPAVPRTDIPVIGRGEQRAAAAVLDVTQTPRSGSHRSQTENPNTLQERLRERIAANTAAAGLPGDQLAEAFQVVLTG